MKIKRIAPGYYEITTAHGKFEICSFQRPENDGYGSKGDLVWYWKPWNGDANDNYHTKRDAVEALKAHIEALTYPCANECGNARSYLRADNLCPTCAAKKGKSWLAEA